MKDLEDYQSARTLVTAWSTAMTIIRTLWGAGAVWFGLLEAREGDFIIGAVLLAFGGWLLYRGIRRLRAGGFGNP